MNSIQIQEICIELDFNWNEKNY